MGLYSYSHKAADEKQLARAQVHDVNASYKDMTQVLAAIKHKSIAQATKILEDAISETKAIPYKKFARRLGHRSELGGKKGRYPKKEAKIILEMLKNAVANAASKGLDKEVLQITAASAHKQNTFMRYRKYWASGIIIGYGRQSFASKYQTCWAEITLSENPKKKLKIDSNTITTKTDKKETKTEHPNVTKSQEKQTPANTKVEKTQAEKEEKQ